MHEVMHMAIKVIDKKESELTRIEVETTIELEDDKTSTHYVVKVKWWKFPNDYEPRDVEIISVTVENTKDGAVHVYKDDTWKKHDFWKKIEPLAYDAVSGLLFC